MTLDQIIYRASDLAQAAFKADGKVSPMWICETADGQMVPLIPTDLPSTPEEKAALKTMLQSVFARLRIVRYVFIAEGYALEGEGDMSEIANVLKNGGVKSHPDRREVVFIFGEDIHGAQRTAMHYILRPEHGPATLSPLSEKNKGENAIGSLTGLLTPEPPSATRH